MHRILTVSLITMTMFLVVGSLYFPDSAALWLADTGEGMNVIRLLVIGLLTGMLFSEPPRSILFRRILGSGALAVGLLTLGQAYANLLQPLDAMIYTLTAILFGLAALERTEEEFMPNSA